MKGKREEEKKKKREGKKRKEGINIPHCHFETLEAFPSSSSSSTNMAFISVQHDTYHLTHELQQKLGARPY